MKARLLCICVSNDIHQVGLFRNPYLLINYKGVQTLQLEIGQIGMAPLYSFGQVCNRNGEKKQTDKVQ